MNSVSASTLSTNGIINLIGGVRKHLIEEFLHDDQLSTYYKEQFKKEITDIKKKFLKQELTELLVTPLDLVHYSKLIKEIKETNKTSIVKQNSSIFYQELLTVFNKYVI
ncbi:MAG TPA: hypothetical protein VIM65_14340 [Cyclobacteriaceae bacterium]